MGLDTVTIRLVRTEKTMAVVNEDHTPSSRDGLLGILQKPGSQRIFVHDYSDISVPTLNNTMNWLAGYRAERAIVMAQPNDLVLVGPPIDTGYLAYLQELGIGPGHDRILTINDSANPHFTQSLFEGLIDNPSNLRWLRDRLTDTGEVRLNTFYSGTKTRALHTSLRVLLERDVYLDGSSPEASELSNRKDLLREAAQLSCVPVAPGELVETAGFTEEQAASKIAAAVTRHRSLSGGVIMRAVWSGGGLDNLVIHADIDRDRLCSWLAKRPHLDAYLVESLLSFEASPNVQLWIHDDGVCSVLETTNQRLDSELAHFGNEYPFDSIVQQGIDESAQVLGEWLSRKGYRGPLGIDFLVSTDCGKTDSPPIFVEVNGRINGATYMIALFERVNQVRKLLHQNPVPAWISSKKLDTHCRDFKALSAALGDLLYTHSSQNGAILYNSGLLNAGSASFMVLADSISEAAAIESELRERLRVA